MKRIDSVQNKTIKQRAKLLNKKERDASGLYLVEGAHLIEEADKAGVLKEVYVLDGEDTDFISIEPVYCTENVLNKLSAQVSSSKMIGVCAAPKFQNVQSQKLLLLENVQDPGNMGTLIRTAYSLGMDKIICSKGCADIFNPKTIQASQGAFFYLPVVQNADLIAFIKISPETEFYAAALHQKSEKLQDIKPASNFGIVLGNEGQGLSAELIQACGHVVEIEMKNFESLNVSIAGGILMYQFLYA